MLTTGIGSSLRWSAPLRVGQAQELQTMCQCPHAHPFIKSSHVGANFQSIIAQHFVSEKSEFRDGPKNGQQSAASASRICDDDHASQLN
jgi:hypothetical protein